MSEVHDQTPPKSNYIFIAIAGTGLFLIVVFVGLVYYYQGTVAAERIRKESGVSPVLEKIRKVDEKALKNIDEMKKSVVDQYN